MAPARGKGSGNPAHARRKGAPAAADTPTPRAEAGGLYADCLGEEEREALVLAAGSGLEQELAVARLLVRRAILEGRPAREVAQLLNCLSGLLKTQHVLAGHAAKQLDEALAAALDAIAAELGVQL